MRLGRDNLRRLAAFALVGLAATACHALVGLAGVVLLDLPAPVASGFGFLVAAVWSYSGHRWLTFETRQPHRTAIPRFIQLGLLNYAIATAQPWLLASLFQAPAWLCVTATAATIPLVNAAVLSLYVFAAPLIGSGPALRDRAR